MVYKANRREPFDVTTVQAHRPRQFCVTCGEEKLLDEFQRHTKSGKPVTVCNECKANKRIETLALAGKLPNGQPMSASQIARFQARYISAATPPAIAPEPVAPPTPPEPTRQVEATPACDGELIKVRAWLGRDQFDASAIVTDNGLLWRIGDKVWLRRIGGSGLGEAFSTAVAIAFAGDWLGIVYN